MRPLIVLAALALAAGCGSPAEPECPSMESITYFASNESPWLATDEGSADLFVVDFPPFHEPSVNTCTWDLGSLTLPISAEERDAMGCSCERTLHGS